MRSRFLLPLLALAFVAAGKKEPPLTVRFFLEANARDTSTFSTPVTLKNPPREAFVEKIPTLSERDVSSIYPFPANDGTMGCAFKLNEHGTFDLEAVSTDRRGSSIIAVVNGRQVIDMLIDKKVSDGIITIGSGLTQNDIDLLSKKFPVLGKPKKR